MLPITTIRTLITCEKIAQPMDGHNELNGAREKQITWCALN